MKLTEINEQVVAVEGRDVNWAILRDGASFTLVDTGYPRYVGDVRESIRAAGLDVAGLEAIVITHAHVDHIGGAPALLRERSVPVFVGAEEVPMALGERRDQATPLDVVRNLWRPRFVPWSLRISLAGGAAHPTLSHPIGVADGALDVPGRPTVLRTPGHSGGHICLQVGEVLFTGDALITGHAVSGRRGPQQTPEVFHSDPATARRSLDRLADVDASVIVAGHGPVWRGSPAEAVRQALR